MVIVYNVIYALLILGPIAVVVWQLIKRGEPKLKQKVCWLAIIIGILIILEAIFGKSGQNALLVEKMAALSALVSLFSLVALKIIGLKGFWVMLAAIVAVLGFLFFMLAGGYRNFIEMLCYLVGQQCFSGVTMYLR